MPVFPLFTRRLHRLLANFTKVHRGWGGDVFEGCRPNVVRLKTTSAVVDKIGYVLANAVAAGAVRYARDWPGVCSSVDDMDAPAVEHLRPGRYFRADRRAKLPASEELGFKLPLAVVAEHGEAKGRQLLEESASKHAHNARAEVRQKGWRFKGRDRVLKTSPYRRARAYEVFGGRNPSFATKGGGKEAFFEAVEELRSFRSAYGTALAAWCAGNREAVFPAGTWHMRVFHGARCIPPS